jgi:XTP/dITP diphosphohydrolase
MSRVVLASRNAHKIEEMARILDDAGLHVEVVGIDAFGGVVDVPEVAETEATFEGNALLKARAVCGATGVAAVSDDSGLCVDALNGMPGVLSARWSGGGGDVANLELVLAQLGDTPDERLGAQFRCAVALVLPDGREATVHGEMRGHLIREPRGTNGFGYDPIFVPDGETRTSAELTSDEKDAISHRGNALRALVPVLRELLPPDPDGSAP